MIHHETERGGLTGRPALFDGLPWGRNSRARVHK